MWFVFIRFKRMHECNKKISYTAEIVLICYSPSFSNEINFKHNLKIYYSYCLDWKEIHIFFIYISGICLFLIFILMIMLLHSNIIIWCIQFSLFLYALLENRKNISFLFKINFESRETICLVYCSLCYVILFFPFLIDFNNYFFFQKEVYILERRKMVKNVAIDIWRGILRALLFHLLKIFFAIDLKQMLKSFSSTPSSSHLWPGSAAKGPIRKKSFKIQNQKTN